MNQPMPQMPAYAPRTAAPNVPSYMPYVAAPTYGYAPQPIQPAAPVYTYAKRRQSIKVHLVLLMATGGLGNIAYAMWANSKVAARTEW